jgi:uncharacterized surface protein with fasciclin (FAS1) repeats
MRRIILLAAAPLAALVLAGCSGEEGEAEQAVLEPSNRTLTETLRADGEYATLSRVVENAGLVEALDGVGPYTLFAPSEAALAGEASDLSDPELAAAGAALIQAHVAPGAMTRADIAAAIDAAGDGSAQVRTMSGGLITFARDGEVITATSPDGTVVRLTGDEELVANGAIQPVDGLLIGTAAAG